MKRICSFLLITLMFITIFPGGSALPLPVAAEAQTVSYFNSVSNTATSQNCTVFTNSMTTLDSGWYFVTGSIKISNITINPGSTVSLVLGADSKLTANENPSQSGAGHAGITVPSDATLNIYAEANGSAPATPLGQINASGGFGAAGIGCDYSTVLVVSGTINIHGGNITATGGSSGAGIGGGYTGSSGAISIYGGIVNATGTSWGAGIGGGSANAGTGGGYISGNAVGAISITGGSVIATSSGNSGAGIGGGCRGRAIGSITISSGVIATGYSDIGNGYNGTGVNPTVYTANFHDTAGNFITLKYTNANIKLPNLSNWLSGYNPNFVGSESITWYSSSKTAVGASGSNATLSVTAENNFYSDLTCFPQVNYILNPLTNTIDSKSCMILYPQPTIIKNGWYYISGNITTTNLAIGAGQTVNLILGKGSNLTANAVSGSQKAGISVPSDATLNIYAEAESAASAIPALPLGQINAKGASLAAGIGGSYGDDTGIINIVGGSVTAVGDSFGAGIGGASQKSGGTINISGGNINATGGTYGAGIGGGNSSGGVINISGGNITAKGGSSSAGIGGGPSGSGGVINISGGAVFATGNPIGGAGIGGGSSGVAGSINITGGVVATGDTSRGAMDIGNGYNVRGQNPPVYTATYIDSAGVFIKLQYTNPNINLPSLSQWLSGYNSNFNSGDMDITWHSSSGTPVGAPGTAVDLTVTNVFYTDNSRFCTVSYISDSVTNKVLSQTCLVLVDGDTLLPGGWYFVPDDTELTTKGLTVAIGQTANIVLGKGAILTANAYNYSSGLTVPKDATLNIYPEANTSMPSAPALPLGQINANGSDYAGIGGNYTGNGSINIIGGVINTTGWLPKACISGSSVNISGGFVSAIAQQHCAGIKGDSINISGGTVVVYGGYSGGIIGGAINITGGSVTASGSLNSHGIIGDTVNITSGVVAKGATGNGYADISLHSGSGDFPIYTASYYDASGNFIKLQYTTKNITLPNHSWLTGYSENFSKGKEILTWYNRLAAIAGQPLGTADLTVTNTFFSDVSLFAEVSYISDPVTNNVLTQSCIKLFGNETILNSDWYFVPEGENITTTNLSVGSGQTANIILGANSTFDANGDSYWEAGITLNNGSSLNIYSEAIGNTVKLPLGKIITTGGAGNAGIGGRHSSYIGAIGIYGGGVTSNGGFNADTVNITGGSVIINSGTITANTRIITSGVQTESDLGNDIYTASYIDPKGNEITLRYTTSSIKLPNYSNWLTGYNSNFNDAAAITTWYANPNNSIGAPGGAITLSATGGNNFYTSLSCFQQVNYISNPAAGSADSASCIPISSQSTTLSSGWYFVPEGKNITTKNLAVGSGQTVNIILGAGSMLNADSSNSGNSAGICVPNGATLNIYAQATANTPKLPLGQIYAVSGRLSYASAAGIGSNYDGSSTASGTINIYGGNITAVGSNGGAGIGGCDGGASGSISIRGGIVNAISYYGGAAIGGGYEGVNGNIVIEGGSVMAEVYAPGHNPIGVGSGLYSSGTPGRITVSSGVLGTIGQSGAYSVNYYDTFENTLTLQYTTPNIKLPSMSSWLSGYGSTFASGVTSFSWTDKTTIWAAGSTVTLASGTSYNYYITDISAGTVIESAIMSWDGTNINSVVTIANANPSGSTIPAVLIVVNYRSDGKMINMKTENINIALNSSTPYPFTTNVGSETSFYQRAFLWNDTSKMEPICEPMIATWEPWQ